MGERRPAAESYSSGFVRGEDYYVPGDEPLTAARPIGALLASCPSCRCTWAVPAGAAVVEHPEHSRLRESCSLAGTALRPTSVVVEG